MATAPHSLNPRFEPSAVETCVDDEISCEIVESVSSEEMDKKKFLLGVLSLKKHI